MTTFCLSAAHQSGRIEEENYSLITINVMNDYLNGWKKEIINKECNNVPFIRIYFPNMVLVLLYPNQPTIQRSSSSNWRLTRVDICRNNFLTYSLSHRIWSKWLHISIANRMIIGMSYQPNCTVHFNYNNHVSFWLLPHTANGKEWNEMN